MADNTTLATMSGGDVVEDIDGANGTGGIKRQVVSLGGIGKSGTHTALTAGQNTRANSIPVTPANDPDFRPASGTITAADAVSSSASGQDLQSLITGAPTANSFQSFTLNGRSAARIQITGTWVGTLAFEGSIDGGTTWFSHPARVCGTVFSRGSVTANGLFDLLVAGLTNLRIRASAWTSGTATVLITASSDTTLASPSGIGVVGQRPFPVIKGAINNGQTSYTAVGLNIGGLITVATGLPPGTVLTALTIRVKGLQSDISSEPTLVMNIFDTNPSGSTFTDNTTQTLVAADLAKDIVMQNVAALSAALNGMVVYQVAGPRLAVDGSGNFYFAIAASGAVMTLSGANKLAYEVDGIY